MTLYTVAQHKVVIKTDDQCHEWSYHPSHFRAVYPKNLEGYEVHRIFAVQFCKKCLKEI